MVIIALSFGRESGSAGLIGTLVGFQMTGLEFRYLFDVGLNMQSRIYYLFEKKKLLQITTLPVL